MKTRLTPIALLAAAAFTAALFTSPVRALVENQSFGIFGVAPVSTQPSGVGQSALTDSTTGTAATTLTAGEGVTTISIPVDLASLGNAASLSAYTPGYAFKILAVTFAVTKPATTGSKLATLTPSISGVNVTGGVLALTSLNATPLGALVQGSSVTAANTGSSTDTITITGSSVTAFVEGQGVILLRVQNMDTANNCASLARQGNAWRTLLVALGLAKGSA